MLAARGYHAASCLVLPLLLLLWWSRGQDSPFHWLLLPTSEGRAELGKGARESLCCPYSVQPGGRGGRLGVEPGACSKGGGGSGPA